MHVRFFDGCGRRTTTIACRMVWGLEFSRFSYFQVVDKQCCVMRSVLSACVRRVFAVRNGDVECFIVCVAVGGFLMRLRWVLFAAVWE